MSIGEVAALLDVPVHTLRYWEREFGAFLKPARTAGSHRLYGAQEQQMLRRIRMMLWEEKYSIAGTLQKLERESQMPARSAGSRLGATDKATVGELRVVG